MAANRFRISAINLSQAEVPLWLTRRGMEILCPKKTDRFCKEPLGLGTAKAGDHVMGCDGTYIHAMSSLAGADAGA